jgi:hypothetical protein
MFPLPSLHSAHHPVLRRHSFTGREFLILPFLFLLLCSSPCPSSAFLLQLVSFRLFHCHFCCAHHPVHRLRSFIRWCVSDASHAISAALLITRSFVGILSTARGFSDVPPAFSASLLITLSLVDIISIAREFQTIPLPSLLLFSSPCPSSAFYPQRVSFRRFSSHIYSAHHPVLC